VELYHKELTGRILGCFFRVHRRLGHGHLESVYERAMEIALREAGLKVERQVPVQVFFEGVEVGHFHADMLVEGCILLELKAAAGISGAHEAQTLNYLCASKLDVGFVLNFGVKAEFRRFAGPEARRRRS
jgi:GxxExxY protein